MLALTGAGRPLRPCCNSVVAHHEECAVNAGCGGSNKHWGFAIPHSEDHEVVAVNGFFIFLQPQHLVNLRCFKALDSLERGR